jgi:protein-S-isoprenylcysteine O-methyltransferase Ste14
MVMTFSKVAYLLWGIFFLFWVISALRIGSHAERRESLSSRLLYLGLVGIAISLIVFDPLIYGPLLRRIVPEGAAPALAGLVVLILGLGFAVWARVHLGRYWSARIALAEDHQLITTGPYRLARNPIYTGGLAGVMGTALVIGEARGVLAILFVLIAFLWKIKLEEGFLSERFGSSYLEYKKKVKSLIPFVY